MRNIKSPCIQQGTLLKGVCIGCYRTQDEIREWFIADDDRKTQILKDIECRKYWLTYANN